MKKKILVTGASGNLGSNLVRELAKDKNNEITIFILKNTWHPFLDNLKIKVVIGDLLNKEDVKKAISGNKFIYHVAGVVSYNKFYDKIIYKTHVQGTKNILEEAINQNVKKVVVTASTAGIGIPKFKNKPLDEKASFDYKHFKHNMYMYSKHIEIKLCKKYAKKGLNVCVISPTTIYGKGDFSMHIGNMIKKIKNNEIIYAPPGGNSVVSMKDVVNGHILAMKKGKFGENYILSNEYITYLDMFNLIAKLLHAKKIERVMPYWMLPPLKLISILSEKIFGRKSHLTSESTKINFSFRYFNSQKAKEELGWIPKQSFEESIKEAINFYKKYKLI